MVDKTKIMQRHLQTEVGVEVLAELGNIMNLKILMGGGCLVLVLNGCSPFIQLSC